MPIEYETLAIRVKSALNDPKTKTVTLVLERQYATPRDLETCERLVFEGAMVDVVVAKEVADG